MNPGKFKFSSASAVT